LALEGFDAGEFIVDCFSGFTGRAFQVLLGLPSNIFTFCPCALCAFCAFCALFTLLFGIWLGILLGNEFAATNEIAIVIQDLSVVSDGISREVSGVALYESANNVVVFVVDFSVLINLESLEKTEIRNGILGSLRRIFGGVFGALYCVFSGALSFVDVETIRGLLFIVAYLGAGGVASLLGGVIRRGLGGIVVLVGLVVIFDRAGRSILGFLQGLGLLRLQLVVVAGLTRVFHFDLAGFLGGGRGVLYGIVGRLNVGLLDLGGVRGGVRLRRVSL
jgi:hypothetical protein